MIIGDITEQKVIDKNVKNKNFVFNFAGIADIRIKNKTTRNNPAKCNTIYKNF